MPNYIINPPKHKTFVPIIPLAREQAPFTAERGQRLSLSLHFSLALLLAIATGLVLFHTAIVSSLTAAIISVGLDLLRAQMIAALLITAAAALISAGLSHGKMGSIIGAVSTYCTIYLADFIHIQFQPLRDPGGLLEPLDTTALTRTIITMLALALASAFIGAAVGTSLGEVLLGPPYRLVRYTWKRLGAQDQRRSYTSLQPPLPIYNVVTPMHRISTPKSDIKSFAQWLAAILMIVILVLAGNSADLFIFSPDVGLHTVPKVHNLAGIPDHGTVVQSALQSAALNGQSREFQIYLPPTYNTPQGANKTYPTLYLLHGSPGKDLDWITGGKAVESADTLITSGKISETIMIFPDGNGHPGATSEWGNSFDKHQLIETYVTNDLVHYVDTHYRTIPDATHRAIGGLSMGGFGAANIAIHHPNVFGSVITLGGYYRAEGAIWGQNSIYMHQNSPIETLPINQQAWKLHMYLGAATKDQPYYNYTKEFMHELDKLHIFYRFDLENGYHSWRVWQTQLYNALLWLSTEE